LFVLLKESLSWSQFITVPETVPLFKDARIQKPPLLPNDVGVPINVNKV